MNVRGAIAIFTNELARFFRTAFGSILSPVLTTALYIVVFGAAIGKRMDPHQFGGASYGAFIVPGLIMLTLLSESTSNASFGIYMPRFTGAIYELLSAPVGVLETLMRVPGETVTRTELLEAGWDHAYENRSNIVDAFVRLLRDKVDRPFGTQTIETVRGHGYRVRP